MLMQNAGSRHAKWLRSNNSKEECETWDTRSKELKSYDVQLPISAHQPTTRDSPVPNRMFVLGVNVGI